MSIQRFLLVAIVSIVTLASFGAALQGYRASETQLKAIFDSELEMLAATIITNPRSEISTQSIVLNGFGFQLWNKDTLISRSSNLPNYEIANTQAGFLGAAFSGRRWRLFILSNDSSRVIVAQPIARRIESTEQVLYGAILPMVIVIPIIGLMVFFAIRKSLLPLRVLSSELKLKNSADLKPLKLQNNSIELLPIESTINSLLNRLSDSFAREKRLSSDAAHELRTPISVLKIAVHNLSKEFDDNCIQPDTISELNESVLRTAHVIEQIISLNRVNPEDFFRQFTKLDIGDVLQNVVSQIYHKIESKGQHISLVCNATTTTLPGEEFSLFTMFKNLVDNASKYGGKDAEIRITIVGPKLKENMIYICVEDSGPGIDKEYLEKVFERYFRLNQQNGHAKGSGLGLSIVRQITQLHHGGVQLSRSDLGGLCVTICLPVLEE